MNSPTISEVPFELISSAGDPIRGEIRFPDASKGSLPVVVICHSFMAFKNWGFFPMVASRIAEAGYGVVTFNFSLNGVEENQNRITNFVKFEQNTFSQEIDDLKMVTDAFQKNTFEVQCIDPATIIFLGHSRGGGVAIVSAAMSDHVKGLVTWSSISTFDRWSNHQKGIWRKLGYLPLAKNSTVSPLRLGISLLHDLEQHHEGLEITKAASRIHIPWLLLHGATDVTVPSREAEVLYRSAPPASTELVLLDHIGHLYNAASEEEDHYQTLTRVLDITIHWLHKHFQKEKT